MKNEWLSFRFGIQVPFISYVCVSVKRKHPNKSIKKNPNTCKHTHSEYYKYLSDSEQPETQEEAYIGIKNSGRMQRLQ